MRFTFREFMASYLREVEAAPSMGTASTPENPSTNNDNHFSMLKQQLGIDDKAFDAYLQSSSIQVYQCPDYSRKWGFLVGGPLNATIKKRNDGNYEITYQLSQKKLMSPKSFVRPYKEGESPILYDGPV